MNFDTWYDLYSYPYESREDAAERYIEEQGVDDPAEKQGFLDSLPDYREIDVQKERQQYTGDTFGDYTPTPIDLPDPDYVDDPDWWDQLVAGGDEATASGASALAGPVSGFLTDYVSEDLGAGLKGWAEEWRDTNLAEAAQVKRPETREEILKRDPESLYQYTPEFFPTGHEIVRSTPTSLAAAGIALPAAVVAAKAGGVVGLAALGKAAVGAVTGMTAGNIASSLQVAGESYERAKNDPAVREELGIDPDKDFKDLLPEDQQKIDRFATDVSQSAFGHRLYTSGLLEMASFIPYGPILGRWALDTGLGTTSEMWDRKLYAEDTAQELVEYGMPSHKVLELQEKMLALGPGSQETFVKALVQEGIMGGGFSAFESITGASDSRVNQPATASNAQRKIIEGEQKEMAKRLKEEAKMDAQAQSLGFDSADQMNQAKEADKERLRIEEVRLREEAQRQRERKQREQEDYDFWENEWKLGEQETKLEEQRQRKIDARAEEIATEENILSGARVAEMNRVVSPILKKQPYERTAEENVDLAAYKKIYGVKDEKKLLDIKGEKVRTQEQAQKETKKKKKAARKKAEDEAKRGMLFARNPLPDGTDTPGLWGKFKQVFGIAPAKDKGTFKLKKKQLASMFRGLEKKFKKFKGKFVVVDEGDLDMILEELEGRQVPVEGKEGEMRFATEEENLLYARKALGLEGKDDQAKAWTLNDKIFINADGLTGKNADEVVEAAIQVGMFHEPIAHIGLKESFKKKFGDKEGQKKFDELMDDFYRSNKKDINNWVTRYAEGYLDGQEINNLTVDKKRELAEEYLANVFVEFGVRDPNIIARVADSLKRGGHDTLFGTRKVTTVQMREMLADIQREYIGGERNIISGDFFDRSHWLKPRAGGKEEEEPQQKPPKVVASDLETKAPVFQKALPEKTKGKLTPTIAETEAKKRAEATPLGRLKQRLKDRNLKPTTPKDHEASTKDAGVRFAKRTKPPPKKTFMGYKLLKMKKSRPGELFPLYIGKTTPVTMNEWVDAEFIKTSGFSPRPGLHLTDSPFAFHIGTDKKAVDGKQKPTTRRYDEVWTEVEVSDDVDWQPEADRRGVPYSKSHKLAGQIKPSTKEIKDEVPVDGNYRYKTNPNMKGEWIIAGAVKIHRILSDAEVASINEKTGFKDLPRKAPLNVEAFGFDTPITKQKVKPSKGKEVRFAKQPSKKVKAEDFVIKGISVSPMDFLDPKGFVDPLALNKKMKRNTSTDPMSGVIRFSKKPATYGAKGGDASWITWADQGKWIDFGRLKDLEEVKSAADQDFLEFAYFSTTDPLERSRRDGPPAGVKELTSVDAYVEKYLTPELIDQNQDLKNLYRQYGGDKEKIKKDFIKILREKHTSDNEYNMEYLSQGYRNDPFFMSAIMRAMNYVQDGTNIGGPTRLDGAALAEVYEEFSDGKYTGIKRMYKDYKARAEQIEETRADKDKSTFMTTSGGKWMELPQLHTARRYGEETTQKDREKRDFVINRWHNLSRDNWCTTKGRERVYPYQGRMHVFRKNGESLMAIRFEGDQIAEIQSQKNNGTIPGEYLEDVKEFVDSPNVTLSAGAQKTINKATVDAKKLEVIETRKEEGAEWKQAYDGNALVEFLMVEVDPNANEQEIRDELDTRNTATGEVIELKDDAVAWRGTSEQRFKYFKGQKMLIDGDHPVGTIMPSSRKKQANLVEEIAKNNPVSIIHSKVRVTGIASMEETTEGPTAQPEYGDDGNIIDTGEYWWAKDVTDILDDTHIRNMEFTELQNIYGKLEIGINDEADLSEGYKGGLYVKEIHISSAPKLISVNGELNIGHNVHLPLLQNVGGTVLLTGVNWYDTKVGLKSIGLHLDIRALGNLPDLQTITGSLLERIAVTPQEHVVLANPKDLGTAYANNFTQALEEKVYDLKKSIKHTEENSFIDLSNLESVGDSVYLGMDNEDGNPSAPSIAKHTHKIRFDSLHEIGRDLETGAGLYHRANPVFPQLYSVGDSIFTRAEGKRGTGDFYDSKWILQGRIENKEPDREGAYLKGMIKPVRRGDRDRVYEKQTYINPDLWVKPKDAEEASRSLRNKQQTSLRYLWETVGHPTHDWRGDKEYEDGVIKWEEGYGNSELDNIYTQLEIDEFRENSFLKAVEEVKEKTRTKPFFDKFKNKILSITDEDITAERENPKSFVTTAQLKSLVEIETERMFIEGMKANQPHLLDRENRYLYRKNLWRGEDLEIPWTTSLFPEEIKARKNKITEVQSRLGINAPNLTVVGRNVSVYTNSYMPNLKRVGGDINIFLDDGSQFNKEFISKLLPNLEKVGGRITFYINSERRELQFRTLDQPNFKPEVPEHKKFQWYFWDYSPGKTEAQKTKNREMQAEANEMGNPFPKLTFMGHDHHQYNIAIQKEWKKSLLEVAKTIPDDTKGRDIAYDKDGKKLTFKETIEARSKDGRLMDFYVSRIKEIPKEKIKELDKEKKLLLLKARKEQIALEGTVLDPRTQETTRFAKLVKQPAPKVKRAVKVSPDTKETREPTVGININDKTQDFTGQILSGRKTMETRDTDSLRAYVGKEVGIIRTGKGKAQVVGYMTVGEPVVYNNREEFKKDQSKHLVKTGSDYDIRAGKTKYGYPLTNVRKVAPFPVTTKGMVARKISAPEVRFAKTRENIVKLEDNKVLPSVSRALKKIQKLGRVSELDPSELIIGETAIQIEPAIDGKSLRFKTLRAFKKGRGDATKTMKLVQGIAEDEGVNLTSKVNAFGKDGMTNKQLDSWYRRLGWMDGDREGEIMFMGEPLVLSGKMKTIGADDDVRFAKRVDQPTAKELEAEWTKKSAKVKPDTKIPKDKVSLGNKKFTTGTYVKQDLSVKKILDPKGQVRTSRVMMGNAAAHAMGTRSWNPLTRWTEKTQPFADKLLERMVAQGTLPDSAEYKDLRRLLKGAIYKAEQGGKKLYDILAKSKQKEIIFEYFTVKGSNPNLITDRAERQAAIEAKEEIHQIGKELVDRKLLHEASFKKLEGAYLPQVYLKYLLGDKNFNNVKAGGKLDLRYLEGRKDLSEGVRKLLLHQVKDPAYLGSKAVAIPRTDMAILDFLQQIALNPKWVLPQSMVTFDVYGELKNLAIENKLSKGIIDSLKLLDTKKNKVSAHWLNTEAQRINDTAPDAELSVDERKVVDKLTKKMKEAGEGKTNEGWEKYDTKDYRQIPKSVKYGSLAGMWVRKEIASDLFGGMNVATGDISTAEAWLGDAGIIGDYNRLWKWAKVSANPPSWVRNFVSNMILMNMGGVPVGRMPDLILSSLADMKKAGKHGGKLHQLAKDLGLTAGTFSNVELGRIEREFKDLQRRLQSEKSGPWAVFGAVKGAFNKVRDVTGDIYGGIDSLGKMMMLKYFLDQKGIDIKDISKYQGKEQTALNEVAAQAEKWLFDYSNVLPSVKWLRRAPLGAPFISFTSFVAPLMLETAITKPWKFAPYYAFGWAMKEWFKNNHDLDEDDLEGLKLGLSEYLREKAKESIFPTGVIPLPFLDENKRVQWLDISYLYPWGMFSEMAGELADGQIGQALKTAGLMGSPLFNIASAVSTGIDPFSRREIVDPMGTPTEQAMDIWWYAFNLTMPPFMHGAGWGNDGFGAGLRMYDAFMGNLSKDGEAKFTMFQASLRMAGINITPLAVPEGATKQLKFEQSLIRKLIYNAEREIKNMYVMQKSASEIQSTIKELREKIIERVMDWRDKVRKATPPESIARPRMELLRKREAKIRADLQARQVG